MMHPRNSHCSDGPDPLQTRRVDAAGGVPMRRLAARRGYLLPPLGAFAVLIGIVVAASPLQGSPDGAHAQSSSNCTTDGTGHLHQRHRPPVITSQDPYTTNPEDRYIEVVPVP